MDLATLHQEWLEADGLGGFAMGTAHGARTRRYHALLQAATTPPAGRFVLVNGVETHVVTPAGRFALGTQHYAPDVFAPEGAAALLSFASDPWPRWRFQLPDGLVVIQEIFVPHGRPAAVLRWRLEKASAEAQFEVRPFFSGRDPHSLQHENGAFRFAPTPTPWGGWIWSPYDGVPSVAVAATGRYTHDPQWYRQFYYQEEAARGLDAIEDLAAPGLFRLTLRAGGTVALIFAAQGLADSPGAELAANAADHLAAAWAEAEAARRAGFDTPLERAADAYLVRRGRGFTIIAGYPWFGDWGRDTFIALRGICLATGRIDEAAAILLEWAGAISEGMLPNRFPDRGEAPEYNSADASLWFVIAVYELLAAAGTRLPSASRARLHAAVDAILRGYARGTRFGIRADHDGLLFAGQPGMQLTWMDAKVGDWVVTPRIGKPVELQALWINALRCASDWSSQWAALVAASTASFAARFWNESAGCLYDVVDVNFVPGANDARIRPNQVLAVGGLPFSPLDRHRAAQVMAVVEQRLLTPLGLRTLDPADPDYRPYYGGGPRERDGAYHQGTVWPWLIGPFIEAWLRVNGDGARQQQSARRRFLDPLLAHRQDAGLGHVTEIADGAPPHLPRGCPFQAWSVAEVLRLDRRLSVMA